jgi:hypothetical protein
VRRCKALVEHDGTRSRCEQEALVMGLCQVHAERALSALSRVERHVCQSNRICEHFLRERFGEEDTP